MKSILMSIQPKWVEKIFNGEKTIEVRKTAPKEVPFKVYIYCTKSNNALAYLMPDKIVRISDKREYGIKYSNKNIVGRTSCGVAKNINGKVIGEFVCDKVRCLIYETKIPTIKQNEDGTLSIVGYTTTEPFYNGKLSTIKGSCLEQKQLLSYGKGKTLYGLHITDLKIYDKQKELGEFGKYCIDYGKDLPFCNCHCSSECYKAITRPPQSWQYVEEVEE